LVGELEQRFEPAEPPADCAVLDAAGVRALAEQPMTEVGAHTVGHPMLSKLDPAQQLDEIVGGALALREITGTPPRFFAYPYGSKADYNADSCRAAEQVGFRAAFVNHGAPFDPGRRPYLVPRWAVPTGLTADDFRTWFDAIPTA
jgi:peptidoglycan/xylan/chitin deacetylase (PgdA/CDA1 family)